MSLVTAGYRRPLVFTAVVVAAAVGLAGCGGSEGAGSSSSKPQTGTGAAVDAALASQLPSSLKGKTLTVATAATYPPMEFIGSDGNTVEGMEPELITAVAQTLGLKTTIKNASFDTIIPGLSSGKYDLAISSMNATPAREKIVTMVSVRTGGTSFVVKAQDPPKINTLQDLCGLKVAVQSGSTQQDDVKTQSTKCTAASKPAPQMLVFADQNQEFLALSSGRAEVVVAGAPGNAWKVKKSNGQLALTGHPYDVETTAIALPKDSPLAKPVADAVNVLIKNGMYKKILTKWGVYVDGIALKKSEVNPS